MDYVPEDLIIVSCNNGHEHQMHSDAGVNESVCPFCGGKLEAEDNETAAMSIMTHEQIEQKQIAISDLADKYLDKALANGESFTEGLCNWAITKAEQEIGAASWN